MKSSFLKTCIIFGGMIQLGALFTVVPLLAFTGEWLAGTLGLIAGAVIGFFLVIWHTVWVTQ